VRPIALALLVGLLSWLAAGASGEPLPDDPRIGEANALLADEARWDRAIELYQAVLADQPDSVPARQWLARVLSWKGEYDEALAQYQHLLALEPPLSGVRAERAEVLSWAGRYDEAEAEFRELLAQDPDDARAARGLARIYRWSGRSQRADRAYRRALALEEDADLRSEWEELRSGLEVNVRSDGRFFRDSEDFGIGRVVASGLWDRDLATRLLFRTTFTRVDHDSKDLPPAAQGMPEEDDSFDVGLGIERRFGDRFKARAEAGFRWWRHAKDRFLARGELEFTANSRTVAGLTIDHGDFLERSYSLAAVLDGLDDTSARISLWRGISEAFDAYLFVEGSRISDGNRRINLGVASSWRPWAERDLRAALSLGFLRYWKNSDLYYDPDSDFEATLSVAGRFGLIRRLDFSYELGAGVGRGEQDGVSGVGPAYRISGGPSWTHAGWRLWLLGSRAQSQRSNSYTAHGVQLSIEREF
jgi:hypothetical protein